jgi:putative transposase
MPRRARLELPGIPMHITHRGVNGGAVFADDADRRTYLDLLARSLDVFTVEVHAYVLMGNHVHLLASSAQRGAISRVMRRVAQCHAQAFNLRHSRSGPLWAGRFKSSPVESDHHLLAVYRYIEANPVRAALAVLPWHYPWSSARANIGRAQDPLVRPHPSFTALAASAEHRACIYRSLLASALAHSDLAAIRAHIAQERALGNPRFQALLERALGRPVAVRPRGRPPAARVTLASALVPVAMASEPPD